MKKISVLGFLLFWSLAAQAVIISSYNKLGDTIEDEEDPQACIFYYPSNNCSGNHSLVQAADYCGAFPFTIHQIDMNAVECRDMEDPAPSSLSSDCRDVCQDDNAECTPVTISCGGVNKTSAKCDCI